MTWPVASVLIALIVSVAALGFAHVIAPDWIERTFSALLGYAVGHAVGQRMQKASDKVDSTKGSGA